YTIDAVTIHGIVGHENLHQLFGFGRIGRLVESTFRSLNNLLEHFHQSFFFYLLPQPNRYVSISQYMPPIILFACALIFQSLSLYYVGTKEPVMPADKQALPAYSIEKRHTLFGFRILILTHVAGLVIFNMIQPHFGWKYLDRFEQQEMILIQYGASELIALATVVMAVAWISTSSLAEHDGTILKSFCLAESALVIATVSLLNFSLGVMTAVLILIPYSFVQPTSNKLFQVAQTILLALLSPAGLAGLFVYITDMYLVDVLQILLSDYQVVRSWFLTFVCTVYWPINMAMMILVFTNATS
ncbi:hypothetical protein CU098_008595, partial [Rhizopus stolonifer]